MTPAAHKVSQSIFPKYPWPIGEDLQVRGCYGLLTSTRHPGSYKVRQDMGKLYTLLLFRDLQRKENRRFFFKIFSMENVERDERVGGTGEDGEEERKIEQFFALIRGFRDAQNKRKNELMEMEERRKRKRKMDEEQSSWVPTFRFEDFSEEIEFRRAPIMATAGRRREDNKVEDQEDEGGLNLKLTL